MFRIIELIKNKFEEIKQFFIKKKRSAIDNQIHKIVINARHNSPSYQNEQANELVGVPKITILGVNQRTPVASGTNVYRTEVDVQNTNLGNGITVNSQRKPGRCPICATRGGILENPNGSPRWLCPVCDSTF